MLPQRCDRVAEGLAGRDAPYPFPVLCDPDRAIAKRYGVWHPVGIDALNTARPAAFLIDAAAHRIRYAVVGRSQFARAPLAEILQTPID